MSKREDLENITKVVNENHQKADEYQQAASCLEAKISEAISAIILEEELLSDSHWNLKSHKTGAPYLEYAGKNSDRCFKAIRELVKDSYHNNYPFEHDVNFQFEDGGMNIYFPDISWIKYYIDTLKLIVDCSPVKGTVIRLRKDLMVLEMLCHQLDITV